MLCILMIFLQLYVIGREFVVGVSVENPLTGHWSVAASYSPVPSTHVY
jgi:hypothetical protein